MKKIAFLIGNLNNSGGTERVTTLIANELSKSNYDISLLSLVEGNQPFFSLEENIKTYSLFKKNESMRKKYFSVVLKIRQFCISNKIDTLVVVDSISCIFTVPALTRLHINHLCWEHFNLKVNLSSRARDLGRWLAAKYCNKVITLTKRDKQFWDEKFGLLSTNKVIAISNPSPFLIQDNAPSLEYKNILCVGRLTHQKGFDLLIPAWGKIAHTLVGWKITIVGTGEDEEVLKQMAIDCKVDQSIDFVGQQSNMDHFYRDASFFCMSSRFEGLPMVLLEAQSYGLPIVAFDCDTGPAEVVVSESSGYLVPAANVDELSKFLLKMCNNSKYNSFVRESFISGKCFNLNNVICFWKQII